MKRSHLLLFGLAIGSMAHAAQAAPFLVSDPYPPSGPQPDTFLLFVDGTAAPIVSPAVKSPDGSVTLKHDLAGLTGQKSVKVRAKNAWGESADSAPFSFTPGAPATPGKIGLSVN